MVVNGRKRPLRADINEDEYKQLVELAKAQDRSLAWVLRQALREYMAKQGA